MSVDYEWLWRNLYKRIEKGELCCDGDIMYSGDLLSLMFELELEAKS